MIGFRQEWNELPFPLSRVKPMSPAADSPFTAEPPGLPTVFVIAPHPTFPP